MDIYMNKPEEVEMAANYPESKLKANAIYNKTYYDDIKLRVPKGYRDNVLKVAASASGVSLNEFMLSAIAKIIKEEYPEIVGVDEWKISNKNNGAP